MASIYKRVGSPYWWLKWKNPDTKKAERLSTLCVVGDGRQYVRAIQMRNEYSIKESSSAAITVTNPFSDWALTYLETTHANSILTLKRYLAAWKLIEAYFSINKIFAPSQVKRADCLGYVAWRKKLPNLNGRTAKGKIVCMNTVLTEMKVMSKVLQEAVSREYIEFNPCRRLGLKREPARVKDEMTDQHIQIITTEISRRLAEAKTQKEKSIADFLFVSFEIARLQGIRMSETYISLDNVDLNRLTLLVRGKGNKLEEVNLNPNLVPLFTRLKSERRKFTYAKPDYPSFQWYLVFNKLRGEHPDFKNISYHSTRVTVITRMERAGLPENIMMQMVLHSSTTVHRGYRRVRANELTPFWSSLNVNNQAAANGPAESPGANETPDSPSTTSTTTPGLSGSHD